MIQPCDIVCGENKCDLKSYGSSQLCYNDKVVENGQMNIVIDINRGNEVINL